jgi:hypothetical protein
MTKFLQANRSEIGLVDRFDLSEIYSRDSRFALSNMLLNPDGLDQIYKLSSDGLTKEDVRTVGGLDRPIIHSLGISDRVISAVSNDLSSQITTDRAVGEPGKQSFANSAQSDNLIVFAGGIAANKIEYNFLDERGQLRTTTVPTSRESLFNSEKNEAGFFEVASYPGLFRIRRRSHISTIKLSSTMLISKSRAITESPTDLLKIPVYMRTSANTNPNLKTIEAYSTKNSPLVLPVRILTSANISFSRDSSGIDASSPSFVFGWELRRFSDNLLVRSSSLNNVGESSTGNIPINVAGTLGAGVDCLLFIYLNPEVITVANLSGIGLKEIGGGQDIGLVGFNSLKELNISHNRLSTFPVWLKTLNNTLETLNIRDNPFWNNGIVSYFDYQDFRGSGINGADTSNPPLITGTQVLGYSGFKPDGTRINGYTGEFDTMQDSSNRLYRRARLYSIVPAITTTAASGTGTVATLTFATQPSPPYAVGSEITVSGVVPSEYNGTYLVTNCTATTVSYESSATGTQTIAGKINEVLETNAVNSFRVFKALTSLELGPTIRLVNPDFSKLFPNLKSLIIDRKEENRNPPRVYRGLIPKLNNSGALMAINLSNHREEVGGSIKYIGDTLEWDSEDSEWNETKAKQFIGQFNIGEFNIGSNFGTNYFGGICTDASDVSSTAVDGKPRHHHIKSGNVKEAWSGWLNNLETFDAQRADIAFKIARGGDLVWKNLKGVDLRFAGNFGVGSSKQNKVEYNKNLPANSQKAFDILYAPNLTNIQAYRSGWWGKIFSIETSSKLKNLRIGANDWQGYKTVDKKEYLLPENFAKTITEGPVSELATLEIKQIVDGGGSKNLEFRTTDFQNLPKLSSLDITDSFIVGKFPSLPNNNLTSGVKFECYIANNRFRDLSALSSPRVQKIYAELQGSGVGGALLPVFSPQSASDATTLEYVKFESSLSTTYPDNWINVLDRKKVITAALVSTENETSTPSVTWTSKTNDGESNANSDKLFHSSPGSFFPLQEILVGDEVFDGGQRLGVVTQIDRNHQFIYINSEVSIIGRLLSFTRRGQSISSYFNDYINLTDVLLKNCRLVGSIPTFRNCRKAKIIDLSNNLLSEYSKGTLQNLTGVTGNFKQSTPLQAFNISYNALPVSSIRNIIEDLYEIGVYFYTTNRNSIRINNLKVNLRSTKLNILDKRCQDYHPSEIFNQTSTSGDGTTIVDPLEIKFRELFERGSFPGITVELFDPITFTTWK